MKETVDLMQALLDNLTKPLGSLGRLEETALRLADVQEKVPPVVGKKMALVFAGDHGVTEEGVSLYPSDVTGQMMLNILGGGAAINVLSRHCGFDLRLIDTGTMSPAEDPRVIDMRLGSCTRNFTREPALSRQQMERCMKNGELLADMLCRDGYDLVAIGDMGIGNTTTAAAMTAGAGVPLAEVLDKGTGIDDETLARKGDVISRALETHGPFSGPLDIMEKVGGFELCTMTAFILALRGKRIACVLDGFPVTSAAYLAWRADPSVKSFLFAGHLSKVKGHRALLERMGLEPLVSLEMRLGEGTGAVLGGFLISAAAAISNEMSSFESAGVSRSIEDEEKY